MKQYWLNLPLASKIAGLTSFLVMVSILTLTYLTIQRERAYFSQELEAQANLLLETLPISLQDPLYRMELDELIDIATVVGQNQNIDQITIYDENGVILFDSTQPDLTFSQVVDPLGDRLVKTKRTAPYSEWQEDYYLTGKPIVLGNQIIGAVTVGVSTQAIDDKVAMLVQQSIILALVTLVVGVILSFWLSRQVTNPLRMLADLASQMASGDSLVHIDVPTNDEVGQLGNALNQFTASIQARQGELRKLAADLECTVEERTIELRQRNELLERMAIEDPLTQIFNRRYFFELAAKEVERAKRYGNPLSVVILDADHFKRMNDSFGHMIGDQILINLAKLIQESIRSVDILARYGGEEFVILMPEVTRDDSKISAERLRKLVAETSLVRGGFDVMITISLGVASWESGQELDFDALLARADQALYQSKESGRNRVSVWQGE